MDKNHLTIPPLGSGGSFNRKTDPEAVARPKERPKHINHSYIRNADGTLAKVTNFGDTSLDHLHYVTVFGEDKHRRRRHHYEDVEPTGDILDNGNVTLDKFQFDYLFGGGSRPKSEKPKEKVTEIEHPYSRGLSSSIPYYGSPQILTTFNTSRKLGEVSKIIPIESGKAWINTVGDSFLTLIDNTGKRLNRTPIYDNCIWDFAVNRKHKMYITVDRSSQVHALTPYGDQTAAGNFLGYQPYGVAVTDDGRLLVCLRPLAGTQGHSKLVIISKTGQVTRELETHEDRKTPLFTDPYNVHCIKSGKIFIRDGNTRVVCISENGKHLYTWSNHHDDVNTEGEEVFNPSRLTSDRHGSLIVSSKDTNKVYILPVDGKGLRCLLDLTHGIHAPCGLGVDNDGNLWVACKERALHIIKY
ncbi:uncharacterized protein LOC110455673 [Mizuhopecten yessoensis]|uniref:Tripartite motif-containing protein 2 n=1 Tax=Mizuhopecten yessoensis TaxID=6573 RepID=A0A210R473_MIZYE|nr:uncharacterized protein LOC110455673 [Mizuhopecten yessoensis]XP_021361626.1 uncharacterized protein LOC110455673 [Mizuhopecten yessoensis]OWF55782.1 hypothetical protein KP79_PYT00189 [Mizuhopecten yessoensis]